MPSDDSYRRLLEFRTRLRKFDAWSRAQAEKVGLTHQQHQLLLVIRGSAEEPTIRDVAEHLLVKHHTAGELADRTQALGLIKRIPDPDDHRRVRLALTDHGHEVLAQLTELHVDEVKQLRDWFPFES